MADTQAMITVVRDADSVAAESARLIVERLAAAIAERGVAHVALTGGSSAVPLFKHLRTPANVGALDWGLVNLWWVDERFVPIDHPLSNAGVAYELLLAYAEGSGQSGRGGQGDDYIAGAIPGLPIDPANLHPVRVDETLGDDAPADLAAHLYERELHRYVPLARGGVPMLDVLMTGVGPDGHIFSLFPGSPGLAVDAPSVLAVPAPEHVEPHVARITMSARVLPAAGMVLVMSAGAEKREILSHVLGPEHDPMRWPAQAALLGNSVWILDEAAAPPSVR